MERYSPGYPEPFTKSLEKGPKAPSGDLRRLQAGGHDFIVRVERNNPNEDYARHKAILQQFEEISGLNVVPFWDVIGETSPPEQPYDDNAQFEAVFHVAKTVTSEYSSEREFPPEVAAQLMEGLTDYHITTYENDLPNSFDISPDQFMYGTVEGDTEPKLYMVDVDYALSEHTMLDDFLDNIDMSVSFLKNYQPNTLLRPVAERLLNYMTTKPEIVAWSKKSDFTKENFAYLTASLERYITEIDTVNDVIKEADWILL